MAAKKVVYGQNAGEAIKVGISKLADAVRVTMGPRGRNVVIEKSFGSPTITKDGVTVAKEIEFEDAYEDIGAKMIIEVASKTNDTSGDGTTTATILAEAIYREGLKCSVSGANPVGIKRGIDEAVTAVIEELGKMSIPVSGDKEIKQVGTIAANNDLEIGEQISNAMKQAGKDGVITVEEGKGLETTVDLVEGMQFDKGFLSPYFVTDVEKLEVVFEDPYILLHEKKISTVKELIPLLEKISETGKSLLIIAEDIEGEVLTTLVVNKIRGTLKCAAVKSPEFGDRRKEMLEDIATLTGGTALFEDLGIDLSSIKLTDLGRAKRVVIGKENTMIIEGGGSRKTIQGRIEQIRSAIDMTTSDYDKEKLQGRLAKLAGGIAKISVGAATEAEMKEKKARIEDAMNATRAAVEEGVLPGGGVALLRAAKALETLEAKAGEDEKIGINIIKNSLEMPLEQIASNAGCNGKLVVQKVKEGKGNFGYDVAKGEYTDLVKNGVIDPTKVVRTALQNAASISGLLLTTDAIVSEIPEKEEK
ncbi:MAG: chaperonin GroEL [Candidatus Scalindua sp. AMX11]|nr:MAG: chaperonin GroEL [Candidatus Scalindua sp.]NOG83213.1 chaperonin GroEL [Planctomycetota bacterium]RZV77577.1 MAG: chaperonin GroEL [Candidatus Scalindua sp. SCAELEC01]TDE64544.1 MAG: chaperonin GroEL [Candidatus Scalindua sp. AMX11]GJQ58645.1 MAG: 60 kDa chaperonin [Candidatus Scalindua sp.]